MRLHKPNNINFEITLSVPLDVVQSNGFFINSKLMYQSMQQWLTGNKVCLLTKTHDTKQSMTCAHVIFMDCNTLKLYCRCIDGNNEDQQILKQFVLTHPNQRLIYTPQGRGTFIDTPDKGLVIQQFLIDYIHIQIPK